MLSSVLSVRAISPKELAGSQGEPGIMGAEPRALSMAVSWGFAKATTMSASPIFAFSENRGIPVKLLICIDFLMNAVKRSFRRLGGFLQPAAVFSSRRWWALAGESGAWLPRGVLRPRERERAASGVAQRGSQHFLCGLWERMVDDALSPRLWGLSNPPDGD